MGRIKKFNEDKYVSYDEVKHVSVCLVCGKAMMGKSTSNIKRHYLTLHRDYYTKTEAIAAAETSFSSTNSCTTNINFTGVAASTSTITRREPSNRIAISMNKNDFFKCCVGLVTVKNLPFGIFDDEKYFKRLLRPYEDYFKVKVNSKQIADEVNTMANKIKQNIAQAVHKKMISLKFDFASRMEQNILVLNIQYMTTETKLCTNTIGVLSLENDGSTNFLCDEISDYLSEFNIDKTQVYAYITDNGTSVLRAPNTNITNRNEIEQVPSEMYIKSTGDELNLVDEFYLEMHATLACGFQVERCFTHVLQLVAQDVLEAIEPQIDDCRQIIEFLRKTQPNYEIPMMDYETNCLSSYTMLNNLYNLKDFIDNTITADSFSPDVDWNFLETFLEAFKPLADCNNKLQCDQYIVGDFYRDLMCCEVELDEIVQKGNLYAQLLVDAFKQKKEILLKNEAFLAALYTDPRFNFSNAPFMSEEKKQIAVNHLLKTYDTIAAFTTQIDDKSTVFTTPHVINNADTSSPYIKLERKMSLLIEQTNSQNLTMQQKLQNLCHAERLPFESNILEYWRSRKYRDLELGKLVDVVLAVPTTQFSAGRTLNALSLMAVNRQRNLSKDTLKNLLLIELNKTIIS